ncbi:MAG TPA: ATP-binding cassette domain-containing protein, partial [Microthrixaceae bacterium]|nr:ATP-binding cassette domain-containing protein [Microthrixaceae bacterium]
MLERYDELPGWARWSINVGLLLGGWLLAALLLPDGAPPGRVLSGMILGAATALTSMGLILIYRSNRVVNFATGAMGAAAGVTAIRLFLIWNWNYALVFVVAVVAGIAVGFLTERLVIRRFDKASRLVLTVATIGLTQVLGGIELLLPTWVFGDDSTVTLGGFETPLSEYRFTVGVDVIDGNHLLILAVVPVVVGGLAWFLTRSQAGIAIRAAAENTDRARLLGIPVGRMQSLVWAIAGGLATLTLVLKSPFAGTPPSAGLGPAVLIPALAAAVIARMESLPVACIAALVLGAVDQVVRWNSSTPALVDVVMLFVILGALLLRRPGTSRAHDGDATWQDTAAVRPIPAVLARLPEIRITRIVAMVVLAATVILVPITLSPSTLNTLNVTVIWGIVALSLVVLTGWNGQVSLGQFALVGCGAIMAGNLMMRWNVDFFLALLAATAVGAVVAFLLGLPALRIRGPFLAVVTLSFAVVLDGYLLNPNNFPELIPQDVDRPVLWERWAMQNERVFFYVCVAVLALVVLCLRGVRRARSGRLLIAGRDNRKAAEAMSVPTRRMALTGFVFSGAIAGLAGGLHVTLLNGARVGSYPTVQSVEVFAMTTIGGLSSIGGGMSGALGLRGLQDAMPSTGARLLLLGTGLLVVLMIVPGGLASVAFGIRDRALRLIARRRGIAVAGLERDEELRAPTPAQAEEGGPEAVALEQGVFSTRNLDVSYGQLQVLFGVDFAVAEGEMVALLGTNGAGKSTLLKAMCGLVGS